MLQLNILSTKEILRTRIPGRNMMKFSNCCCRNDDDDDDDDDDDE